MENESTAADLTGIIVHGKGLGRTVGMPTANLSVPEGTSLPAEGVYAAIAVLTDGSFPALVNIGHRPTVDDEDRVTVEALRVGKQAAAFVGHEEALPEHLERFAAAEINELPVGERARARMKA